MSLRTKAGRVTRPVNQLGVIDLVVLEAHKAGTSWKKTPGMHSEATYLRTLARAQRRQALVI